MKKKYNSPEIDIEKFNLPNSVLTASTFEPGQGQGGGDEEVEIEF